MWAAVHLRNEITHRDIDKTARCNHEQVRHHSMCALQEEVSQSLSGKNLNRFTKWRSPIQDKKLIRREVFNELVDEFTSEELAGNQVLIKALLRMRKKIDPQADLQETKNLLTGSGSSLDRVLTRLRKNIENEN